MQASLLIDQFEMPNQGLFAGLSLQVHPRAAVYLGVLVRTGKEASLSDSSPEIAFKMPSNVAC